MASKDFEELKAMILSSASGITQQIQTSQQSLETKFNQFEININTEMTAIKTSVDEFKSQVNNDIQHVHTIFTQQEQRILNNENDIQRLQRGSDLRIVGFPVKENENLMGIFEQIAKEIGYDTTTINCTID